ncbi:hypothetical protein ACQJBY_062693 [Aegilops geniculata]
MFGILHVQLGLARQMQNEAPSQAEGKRKFRPFPRACIRACTHSSKGGLLSHPLLSFDSRRSPRSSFSPATRISPPRRLCCIAGRVLISGGGSTLLLPLSHLPASIYSPSHLQLSAARAVLGAARGGCVSGMDRRPRPSMNETKARRGWRFGKEWWLL